MRWRAELYHDKTQVAIASSPSKRRTIMYALAYVRNGTNEDFETMTIKVYKVKDKK